MFQAIKQKIKVNLLKSRGLHFDILSSFFFLQVLTAASIIYYTYVNNARTLLDFSNRLVNDISESAVNEMSAKLKEVQSATEVGSYILHDSANVSPQNTELLQFMIANMRQLTFADSMYVGTEEGTFLQIQLVNNGATYRGNTAKLLPKKVLYSVRFIKREGDKAAESWYYLGSNYEMIDQELLPESVTKFDPRVRPWYQKTSQVLSTIWTDLYVQDVNRMVGITCAVPLVGANGKFIGAIGTTVTLKNFSNILQNIPVNGIAIVVNKKGEIVAHPTEKDTSKVVNGEAHLLTLDDLSSKKEAAAFKMRMQMADPDQTFIMNFENTEYIVDFQAFKNESFSSWEFFIVTPIDVFIGRVKEIQKNTMLICLFILIVSIFLIAYLARRIARPIDDLSRQADRINTFDLSDVKEVQSNVKEIQNLQNSISRMRSSLISFGRFVPKNLVRKMIDKGIEVKIGGKRKNLSIFFSDIANFTTISETYPSEKLVQHLSEYFEEMSSILTNHHGTIDKYIGDAIMAFWGAPQQDSHHALNCCLSALLCQKRLLDLNRKWKYEKKPELATRIGIHVGEAIVGNIGSSERMNYTLIGDSVNLAARLEGTNKMYGTNIIVSESTVKQLHEHAVVRPLDIVAVKGKNEGIKIYELVALNNSNPLVLPTSEQQKMCETFSKAFNWYLEQRWDEAISAFQELINLYGKDYACELYIKRCSEYKENPPPADWDGIFHMRSK